MEIQKKMQDALNGQINNEFYSAYMYLAAAGYFEGLNLRGFAQWFKTQAEEEKRHGMKIFDYIYERNGEVNLTLIQAPKAGWKSPLSVVEEAYQHEQKVTKMIHDLLFFARKEQDLATEVFLQWFVKEQIEEEDSTRYILEKLKILDDSRSGLQLLDTELGARKKE